MTEENNTISKLEDLLKQIEKQDYVKIKYEDLTETLEEAIKLIQKQQEELEEKDKIIDNAINEIETLRQYFSEDTQSDFIRILEVLKYKKVTEW